VTINIQGKVCQVNNSVTLFYELFCFLIPNKCQLLLLTSDTLFQFHYLYKSSKIVLPGEPVRTRKPFGK